MARDIACLYFLLYPGILLAEVSAKELTVDSFWIVGIAAAVLYFVCARFKPRLGVVAFIPAALWFVSLFLEIHSPDVGPHLRLEQGSGHYTHAYIALALAACGLAAGYTRHRHQTKKRCRAAFRFPLSDSAD